MISINKSGKTLTVDICLSPVLPFDVHHPMTFWKAESIHFLFDKNGLVNSKDFLLKFAIDKEHYLLALTGSFVRIVSENTILFVFG